MPHPDRDDLTERVNRAYWETDAGVNHIAEALDVSKSALYGMVQPLETGDACPICGGGLAWENRTARDRDDVVCLACAGEGDGRAATPAAMPAGATAGAAGGAAEPSAARAAARPLANASALTSDQARTLGGAVLLGLGAGFLAAAMLIRRR